MKYLFFGIIAWTLVSAFVVFVVWPLLIDKWDDDYPLLDDEDVPGP